MKEQAIQYLAMDVHQATVTACVRDERRSITMGDGADGVAGDPVARTRRRLASPCGVRGRNAGVGAPRPAGVACGRRDAVTLAML
jgi:hypothetical protein